MILRLCDLQGFRMSRQERPRSGQEPPKEPSGVPKSHLRAARSRPRGSSQEPRFGGHVSALKALGRNLLKSSRGTGEERGERGEVRGERERRQKQ